MDLGIFKQYDIRGIYPKEIDEETAYLVGRAFVNFLRKKSRGKKFKIVLARDVRTSSPILFRGFSRAIINEGCDVVDVGVVTTPMFYFAVSKFNCRGGAMITASHNPKLYNGIKLVREKAIPIGAKSGLFWIRDRIIKSKVKSQKLKVRGKIIKKNIDEDYINFCLKLAGVRKNEFKGLSLAVDAGNGIAGPVTRKILKITGCKFYPLYFEPDGSFPNHPPDPLVKQNLIDLIELVQEKKLNLGVAFDGDGDRIIFVDEKGNPVSGDLITALMAKILLNRKRGKILYDVRSSNVVPETIKASGGKPVVSKIGHVLIKEKMRKENVLFGGELSGHYYLGEGIFYEVPFYVLLKLLKEMREKELKLSSLVEPLKKYYFSGEINFKVRDKIAKIQEIKKKYQNGKVTELDGLRVDFPDWWFLIRPSNTEPLLRLVVEAKTKRILKNMVKELTNCLTS